MNLNQAQGDEGEELDLLRMSLPQQTDADSSLAALFTALVPEGTQLNAEHIEALVHDAGLQYEAKVWRLGQLSLHALKTVAETLVKGLLLRVPRGWEGVQRRMYFKMLLPTLSPEWGGRRHSCWHPPQARGGFQYDLGGTEGVRRLEKKIKGGGGFRARRARDRPRRLRFGFLRSCYGPCVPSHQPTARRGRLRRSKGRPREASGMGRPGEIGLHRGHRGRRQDPARS